MGKLTAADSDGRWPRMQTVVISQGRAGPSPAPTWAGTPRLSGHSATIFPTAAPVSRDPKGSASNGEPRPGDRVPPAERDRRQTALPCAGTLRVAANLFQTPGHVMIRTPRRVPFPAGRSQGAKLKSRGRGAASPLPPKGDRFVRVNRLPTALLDSASRMSWMGNATTTRARSTLSLFWENICVPAQTQSQFVWNFFRGSNSVFRPRKKWDARTFEQEPCAMCKVNIVEAIRGDAAGRRTTAFGNLSRHHGKSH
jgi:hypothetical protein